MYQGLPENRFVSMCLFALKLLAGKVGGSGLA